MEDLYVSLSNAARLLEERRALRRRIERWWSDMGWHIPQLCYSFDGVLVFGKAVATRRYEDVLFCHYAEELGLRPVWMEHTQGRLSTRCHSNGACSTRPFSSGRVAMAAW